MATIAKLPSGKFKAIIKKDGKILKTKTFLKKSHARTWAKRIENDQEALYALGLSGTKITLKELAREFLDNRDVAKNTRLDWFVKKLGPTKAITDITVEDLRSAMEEFYITKSPSTHKKRSPATYNRAKALMSGLFKYGANQGYIQDNPVKPIPSKSENNKVIRYLSDSERDKLLEAVRNADWPKFELLITLALTTGARRGELMQLKWSDIDFEQKVARLSTSKNGEPRIMPLPLPAISELKKFRGVGSGLIFASQKLPKRPFHFQKQWNKAIEDAGIKNFRFHDLRHSCASYLAMSGCSLLEIAEVLGHKSVQTTKRYAHLSTDHKAKVVSRVFDKLI